MPIDGLVSGLDTNSIIEQLMAAERVPVDLMTARKTAAQASLDAYKSVQSKLSAIATASAALERSSGWRLRSTTTSNDAVATATASDNATLGGIQFTVDRLSTTHGVASATSVPTLGDIVASSGSVQLTVGATPHNITVGGGSLAEVAAAINDANVGVKAATVNTGSGYRLQLTAATSGAAAAFTVSGLDVGTAITTQGVDAQLTFGTGPGAYAVTSATNSFANVLPGVTVNARSVSATPVAIDVSSDAQGLAGKVKTLVDSVNSALAEIKTRTAYDAASNKAASLAGDAAARRASQALTRALSDAVGQSALGSPGLAGVSIDRNGNATFDQAKFLAAYTADPAAVERLFVQGATTTGAVQFVSAGSRAQAGPRDVVVTLAATQANQVGMVGQFPLTVPATIRIKMGGTEIVYPAGPPDDLSTTVNGLQSAIDGAGLALTVTADGGGVKVTSDSYGTGASYEVDFGTGSYATVAGTDAVGTIDGITATGVGRQLSIPGSDGTLSGMSVLLTSDATGTVGTVNYEPGLAQRISGAVAFATDNGYLDDAEASRQSKVDLLTSSIDSYNVRLEAREKRLRLQFANLETLLSQLKSQSSMLASQIGSATSSSSS